MAAPQAPWADLRFFVGRLAGLARRARTSLRTRGLRATLDQVLAHVRPAPAASAGALYAPEEAPFASFTLGTGEAPVASIVIPVFDQFTHTLACLRALAEHPPATAHEVIVVDDGSSDDTATRLPQIAGLRYHRRAANGGFVAACNEGASLARGEFLVFLNNDTVPQPGWLEALLSTFAAHPDTGLAGAQLIYPDGRLQESGGLVFSDGSGWNYGRFGDPDDPRYAFVRETDYCSGAAIAIRRALFDTLGRFDTRYSPAYYEDTDLAFAVREHGLKVRVQPAAKVVHHEGATSGTDVTQGAKAYQVRNRDVFVDKWREALSRQPAAGGNADEASQRAAQTVLIVDALMPDATRDSGSLRLINLMRLLVAEGSRVVFLAANRRRDPAAALVLQALGVETWYAPFAARAPAWLRAHGERFDVVVLSRHYVASEFIPLVRKHARRARIVFDTVDLHFLRERRGAELDGNRVALAAAERTRELELGVMRASDATLVVSEAEVRVLAAEAPDVDVAVLSNVHDIAGRGLPFDARHGLVFVGGFRHPPNVDAVLWFAQHVLPRVRNGMPDAVLHCIGADAPAEIAALAATPGIRIHGHVPDIRPWMDGARIAVAPLRYGAGVKGKINLSMAHGQPVVATTCAAEGMHLRNGEDVLVADDPQPFADALLRLYRDEDLWNRLAVNGLENVAKHFSMDAARETVQRVILGRCD